MRMMQVMLAMRRWAAKDAKDLREEKREDLRGGKGLKISGGECWK